MDQTQLQEKIALYYSKLPADAQAVFSSMKWMDTLKSISVRYGLKDDQIETLGLETTLLLLGIIHMEEYEGVIKNELRIPEASAKKMLDEIDTEVLRSIRGSLGTAYNNHVKTLVEDKYGKIEKLDERFEKLPKSVQTAISESNYQEKIYTIASKYKLSIDQMGEFEEATTKVLLGITHPDQYENEVGSKLQLPKEEVVKIVSEVNEQILKNIREILRKHWEDSEGVPTDANDEVPIPPYAMTGVSAKKEEPSIVIKKDILDKVSTPTTQENNLSKKETDIYGSAGIEIADGMNILEAKLKGVTLSKNTTSVHSNPKQSDSKLPPVTPAPAKEAPATKAHDPYHEVIE